MSRQDLILATIRTAVPAAIGAFIAWVIARIPAVADIITTVDGILAESAPGFTVVGILGAICIGLVTAAYFWIVRQIGQRWPIVERFLLGSAKQPIGYARPSADGRAVVVTSLALTPPPPRAPSTRMRSTSSSRERARSDRWRDTSSAAASSPVASSTPARSPSAPSCLAAPASSCP